MTRTVLTAMLVLCSSLITAEEPAKPTKYDFGPDSQRVDGVPQGKVTDGVWKSTILAGTIRQYWVYLPAQYDGTTPCVPAARLARIYGYTA